MKRKPMARGSGFKRPVYEPAPADPGRITRSFTHEGATAGPAPKTQEQRNPTLLAMARGESCLLRVLDVCNYDRETTVAAHSNQSKHGKAGARKADDQYHVWACSACHHWLDQGNTASYEQKCRMWNYAFEWMVSIWRDIAGGWMSATPAQRKAARWALDRIEEGKKREHETG